MRKALCWIALVLAAFSGTTNAANTLTTDASDMWWNASESGWGVNLTSQQEVIFLSMFVYGADGKTKWYSASTSLQGFNSAGAGVYTGTLIETTRPYFGGSYNQANVTTRTVGSVTLNLFVESGTINYSIDGVSVTKAITRYTFRNANMTGSYLGAAIFNVSGCTSGNGAYQNTASFSISHNGNAIAIAASLSTGISCTYSGTYAQNGRMGSVNGTLQCSNGGRGTFRAFETEASYQGFFTRYTADYGGGCTESGRIGGMKQ